MYRVTSHIFNSWKCRPTTYVQIKPISKCVPDRKYKDPTERDTCPKPPPLPPPPPKDDRLLWGALAAVVLAGGFAYYAKQQPEVRDWLSMHASWFDDFVAVLFQENMTYSEYAEQCMDDIKKCLNQYMSDNKPRKCSLDGEVVDNDEVPDEPPEIELKKCDEFEEKPKCELEPPPVITKDICEIDKCLRDLGDAILHNYYTAKEACAYYNRLVEEKMRDFKLEDLKELHCALNERIGLVQTSNCNISEATPKMTDLTRYLECGVQASKEAIAETRGLINDYKDKIDAARMQYQWQYDKSIALDAQVAKVEELVNKYVDENQTLFTGLRYDSKKPTLSGDPDLLLYHTLRYAKKLREELDEAVSGYTDRVNRAMDTLPQCEKELKQRCALLGSEIKKRRAELEKEYKKRYDDQRANNDKILRESLKMQHQRHMEILQQKLLEKEKETTVKLNKLVAEKVAAGKKMFADQLADMAAKLKVVEDKLNARLKAERETRRSQELWSAGASLLAATQKGDPFVRVDKELKAIEKAKGDGDKLVETVLKAIPESVRTQGIVPESVLKERYHKMEKAALAVAMVEADGGPMPIFILSWLQSVALFMKLSCIPQREIDKPLEEPYKDLDTFDLLRRARYYVERDNLAAAVRYVASLEGASRAAASTWHDAARSHLETRQAAEAVLAHAAALGLQYI